MNQSASEIESSFNHHKAMLTNNLSATLDLMILKENEYKSIECLFANTSIFESLFKSLNDKIMMNNKVYKIIKVLQKIIKKSTFLKKSSN